jgi:hypothetical protein
MSLLAEPQAPVAEATGPVRRRRRAGVVALAAALALAAAWLLSPHLLRLAPPAVTAGQLDGEPGGLLVEGYGAAGTYALHYRYGETVTLRVPLANDSPVPLHVTDVELVEPTYPLLEPVGDGPRPFTLLPGQDGSVELAFEYTNCRYYHERANNTVDRVRVTGTVLGREVVRTVELVTPVVVHSQVIINCPERTFVRGDDRRT